MKRPKQPKGEVLQELGVVPFNHRNYIKKLDKYIDWLIKEHNKLVDDFNHLKENQAC